MCEGEQRESGKEGGLPLGGAGRAGMLPSGFLRQRLSSGSSGRALATLTGDPAILRTLHRTFTWILHKQLPMQETVASSPPLEKKGE